MKQLRRRLRPSNDKRRSAFLAAQDRPVRRALLTERLESRNMMAGDFMSPYWNALTRSDVNQDGSVAPIDALVVINELNVNGSYSLLQKQSASGAEGEGSQQQYMYDVNNDGSISPIDALIVINDLNAEGEGANDVARYYIYPVAVGTDTPITTIEEGQDFELVMKVDDARPGGPGVFAAYIDLQFDTSRVDVYVNEVQHININGFPTGGDFTLSFNGATTAAIEYNDQVDMVARIRDALVALPTIGANDIEVFSASIGGQVRYGVRFVGTLGDTDVPEITGDGSGLEGGSNMSVTVTESEKGVDTDPAAFRNAFLTDFTLPNGFKYNNSPSANLLPDRFDDVGAVGQIFLPGTTAAIEFARVRMNVTEAGRIDFLDDVFGVDSAHETLVYASSQDTSKLRVLPEEIGVYRNNPALGTPLDGTPAFLFVTEKLAANTDSATTNEGQAVTIPVVGNDVTDPAGGTVTIQSVNTTGAQGTAQIQGNSIVFTPAADFHGSTSFTYVARTVINSVVYTDVGTVNVTVNPVNDAPVITLPAAPTVTEDVAATINGISVVDVDAASANLSVTLTSTKGTLTLGSTTGLDGLTGNTTNNITFQGTLTEINSALSGLIFTPTPETSGAASITLTVNDQGNGPTGLPAMSDTKTLNFNIASVNDAPVLNIADDELSVLELETLDVTGITVTDVDADAGGGVQITLSVENGLLVLADAAGDGVTVSGSGTSTIVVTGPIAGTANVNTVLPGLKYTPDADFFDIDTLSIDVTDLGHTGGPAQTASGEIAIDVIAAIRPRARRDLVEVAEDSATGLLIDVLDNDFVTNDDNPSPDATPILLGIEDGGDVVSELIIAGKGTATVENGQIRFVPVADFDGVVEFNYRMTDSERQATDAAYFSTGLVRVTINPKNADAPVAGDDTLATTEDAIISTGNLLSNDTDPDTGDTRTAVAATITSTLGAAVTINADGTFSYDPTASAQLQALAAAATATDSFTYTVRDALGATDTGTVTITVTGINDLPVGVASQYTVAEEGTLTVAAPGVLTGASDRETASGSLTAVLGTTTANGSLTLNADGSFEYEPNENFHGADSFTFRVNDGTADSALITVAINVTPVNDAPVAEDDAFNTTEDATLSTGNLLTNDSDVDTGDTRTAVATTLTTSQGATVTIAANGTFVYNPTGSATLQALAAGAQVQDTFTYTVRDSANGQDTGTVTITVTGVNDAPVGVANAYMGANEDAVFNVLVADSVLNNDTDVDTPDTKNAVAGPITTAKGATVTMNADGSFSYDATGSAQIQATAQGATTTDTFTYTVRDTAGATSTATVTITINGVNDGPTANDDAFGAIANVAKTFDVLGNDTDVDTGDTLTIQSVTQPTVAGASVTFDANGEVTYTAPAGYEGADSFTYTIVDSAGATSTATVNVTVQNFIPTDISGYVYIDKTSASQPNGNGQFEAGERGVANVTLVLSSPTGVDMFGNPFTPVTVETDATGYYVFPQVVPGNFVITQVQPDHLRDGLETATDGTYARIQASQNNKIFIDLPQLGAVNGKVENNNFAELGIDASSLDNSAGLMQEMLASSSQNGLVASTDMAGGDFWFWALNNWSGLTSVDIQLSSNMATLTLTATINGVTKTATIGQQPNSLGGRFRVLGWTDEGGYLIRIDGKASDFQWAAVQQPAGEGEGTGDADAQYIDSVDQVLAEQNWA